MKYCNTGIWLIYLYIYVTGSTKTWNRTEWNKTNGMNETNNKIKILVVGIRRRVHWTEFKIQAKN